MKSNVKTIFYFFSLISSLTLNPYHLAYAEIEIEEQNNIYIDASIDDSDNSIYSENWSDQKKIRDKNYDPFKDSSQFYLLNPRYFVINGKTAVFYYPLSETQNPALLYTSIDDKTNFILAQSYGSVQQSLTLKKQLPNQFKDHQLFAIQEQGKNLLLIFRSRYILTPTEKQHNAQIHQMFADNLYRSSYELIEVTPEAKLLHRAQFIAPNPENGMGFGPKFNDKISDYEANIIQYQTKTPGDYQTVKPFDIEHIYDYQNGQLRKNTHKHYLSISERRALKENVESINAELLEDQYRESQKEQKPQPSSCLSDFWVFHDKAAPKGVNWGNPWLQQQTKLYQTFIQEYESGKHYSWSNFRKRYCELN
ncbi:hypothetical protein ACNQO6_17360 [Acinetobacter calcoaceticus]|jgi:hypothetical protein|uniref:hypothetical protein n=1 Tax=Acinetobacter calcoaceticus TaxID=471 RepID=UPI002B29300A|nr:hypothetical protein SB581_18040 [Acinetobacter baumannii]